MGATSGIPDNGIIYTGTRDELQRKLRARDDRITELESLVADIASGAIDEGGNRRNHPAATAMARKFLGLD